VVEVGGENQKILGIACCLVETIVRTLWVKLTVQTTATWQGLGILTIGILCLTAYGL